MTLIRFFMSEIALLIVVQCITCLNKTDTNVGATKPDKNLYIIENKSESPLGEEEMAEDNSEEKTNTNSIYSIITKPVNIILSPIKGVLNSLKTVVKKYNPQRTENDKPLKNST